MDALKAPLLGAEPRRSDMLKRALLMFVVIAVVLLGSFMLYQGNARARTSRPSFIGSIDRGWHTGRHHQA